MYHFVVIRDIPRLLFNICFLSREECVRRKTPWSTHEMALTRREFLTAELVDRRAIDRVINGI